MASKISINLDTSKENYILTKCKQDDDLTLEALIYENGLALELSNKEIIIKALKADNTYINQSTEISKENNKITAELVRDFTRVPGTTKIEVLLIEGGKQNTTFSFYLEVAGSVTKGAVESSNTVTIIEELDKKVLEAGQVKAETELLIKSGGAATKEDITKVNSSLEQIIIKQDNIKTINLLDVGVVVNDRTKAEDNTKILNNLSFNNRNKFLLPSGEYYFSGGIVLENNTLVGDGYSSKIIIVDDTSPAIRFGGNNCYISNLNLQKEARNFSQNSIGLEFGRKNNEGTRVYSDRLYSENLWIKNFTTSLAIEGVYFIDISNVNTSRDKFGFTVNKDIQLNSTPNLISTTININHMYCNGTGNSFDIENGSVGWEIYDVSDITLSNCVSEWYEKCFHLDNMNNFTFNSPYLEHCNIPSTVKSFTGAGYINNPYFNNAVSNTSHSLIIYTSSKSLVLNGGRAIGFEDGQYYVTKNTEGTISFFHPFTTRAVRSDNGWEYQGVNIISGNNILKRTKNANEKAFSCRYYDQGIDISPVAINQNDATKPINFNIRDINMITITKDGDMTFNVADKGIVLKSTNGNNFRIKVSDDGVLSSVKI